MPRFMHAGIICTCIFSSSAHKHPAHLSVIGGALLLDSQCQSKPRDSLASLGHRVSEKLEEGDFKGAVRLACSEDSMEDRSAATFTALKVKHCSPHPNSSIPPSSVVIPFLPPVSVDDVARAIRSFPNGSAGGSDGLRRQHLKDMTISSNAVDPSLELLSALASFFTLLLEGKTPLPIHPFFFGATLIALEKKGGGPIAVGCTLRRLVAKIAGFRVLEDMATLLAPRQLGYGIRGGAEAAVHATRRYLSEFQSDQAIVKLDFKNTFNTVHRNKMLEAVEVLARTIYPFVHSVYSSPSSLIWGDKTICSSEGVQQGDPLGPLLFCLSIHHHCTFLSAGLCVMYLDDITLGGSMAEIGHDLEVIESLAEIGLCLDTQKSEIICNNLDTREAIIMMLPGAQFVDPSSSSL